MHSMNDSLQILTVKVQQFSVLNLELSFISSYHMQFYKLVFDNISLSLSKNTVMCEYSFSKHNSAKSFPEYGLHICLLVSSRQYIFGLKSLKNVLTLLIFFFFFRNARLSFQHACGTFEENAKECLLQLQKINLTGTNDVFFEVPDNQLFNNGSLRNVTVWPKQDLKLPIIHFGERIQFYSNFDPMKGGVNLDNIHFHTRQK